MPLDEPMAEGARQMTICNACRYCEGYCAVFPAMERRLDFTRADMNYLANLCHNCGECLYACQYSPPHEFAINLPQLMARIRAQSYREYAWPRAFAALYRSNGTRLAVLLALCVAGALGGALLMLGRDSLFAPVPGGDFYAVVPHAVMAWGFSAAGAFAVLALLTGFVRFWQDSGESLGSFANWRALGRAAGDVLTLRNLHGAGADCTEREETRRPLRRWFHHLTFYGFMLCFAATLLGTLYHYGFGWHAPYGYASLPVLLGTLGGLGLVVGPAGLHYAGRSRDSGLKDLTQGGMDAAFIVLLSVTAFTGLLLCAFRATGAMPLMLVAHLGAVLALFLALPYGKFVHGLYRSAALVKNALEQSRPGAAAGME